MRIEDSILNELIEEPSGVLRLSGHSSFAYTDGNQSEKYLESIFRKNIDLSSNSVDLLPFIKDWPSEYHLSNKRHQLLSGFDFDPELRVLEVGCGCGAITRYLAENFDTVLSIEGSPVRANLARMRSRKCDNVDIVCAPFQQIQFKEKFDLIVCVGVLEYSALFVDGDDPYENVLRHFSELLSPSGQVLIAIENQFGLKYFSSSREDHLKLMFEGIEGYPVFADKVRTFGRKELEQRLANHFNSIQFYYPYPDYKLPDGVFSEAMLRSVRAGELISNFTSRDYYGPLPRLFNESLTTLQLAKNDLLTVFSNSFLVIASKSSTAESNFNQLGIMFSSKREKRYLMKTRFIEDISGIRVEKSSLFPDLSPSDLDLKIHPVSSLWIDGYSLHIRILLRALNRKSSLVDSFSPVKFWLDKLVSMCDEDGSMERSLSGNYVDCIWKNTFFKEGEVAFIDQEWEWCEKLSLQYMFIRSMFFFLLETQDVEKLPRWLKVRNTRNLIRRVADSFELTLSSSDFAHFVRQEAALQAMVYGKKVRREQFVIKWYLTDRGSLRLVKSMRNLIHRLSLALQSLWRYVPLP